MNKLVRAFVSFVAAVAVAIPVLSFTLAGTAGASTVTYTATQSFTPPSSNFAGASGGGDGWGIATYNGRVYNVFHHQSYFGLNCHNQSDASNCWTTTDTGTSNLFKTITVGGNAFGTSGKVGLYVDQSTGYLYVYATQVSNLQTGVVCINLNAADTVPNPTCTGTNGEPPAFTPLAAAGTTGWTTGNPYTGTITPTYYQGKLYAWSPVNGQTAAAGGGGAAGSGHNTLLCYDITTQSACANEPFAVSVGTTAGTNGDGSPAQPTTLVGSEMFIPSVWGGGPVVACVDLSLSTPGNCAGTWPQSMGVGPSSMVTPLLDSAGNSIGVCALNSSSTWLCWGLDGSIQPTPTGLTASVLTAWQWTGSPVVVGTRVFEISGLGGSNPGLVYCYDFATNAACTTATGHFPFTVANTTSTYTLTADSQRPTCIWINSDGGSAQIQNFDALTGGSCANAPVRVFASSFVEPYQACVPTAFNTISLTAGNIATSPAPTLSFTNGNGVVIDGPYPFNTSGAHPTIDLTSLAYPTPINLSTQAPLPQFVLNLTPGTSGLGTVSVEVSWSGSPLGQCSPGYAGPAPATSAASGVANTSAQFNGSVNNTSSDTVTPVQFCYSTTNFNSGQCTGTTVTAVAGTVAGSVTPYSAAITTLAPSTTYYYELVATDSTTSSPLYGGVQQFTTGPIATTSPVSSLSNTAGTLNGSLYNPGGNTFSAVNFCYQTTSFTSGGCSGTTGTLGTALAGSSSPSGTAYSLALTGLHPGSTYYYELEATDSTTTTTLDGGVQHFIAAPVTRTSAATAVGDTTATIDGSVYNPNSDTQTAQFCYAATAFTTGNCSTTTGHLTATAVAGSSNASTTPYSAALTGLTPGTTYYYELVVTDTTTSSTYNGGVFSLATGPTATTGGALNIQPTTTALSGSIYNPAGDAFTSVQFCYQTTPFTTGNCAGTTATAVAGTTTGSTTAYTYTASSLVPGLTYYYELVATDSALTPSVYDGGVQQLVTGPVVTTAQAGSVTSSSATLLGSVNNPNNMGLRAVDFCFQATPFTSGNCAGTIPATAGSTTGTTTSYSANVTGMSGFSRYYYELVVAPSTAGGPFYGGEDTFQTAGIAPTITSATITGTPTVGQTLTAHSGGVGGAPTPTESYQWYDNGQAIPNATGSTYLVQSSDYNQPITVTITETNTLGHASATSTPTKVTGVSPAVTTPQITVSGISPAGVGALTWSPSQTSGGATISGYQVEYSTDGGKTWITVPSSDVSGTSATIPGLSIGKAYSFRVVTQSSMGAVASAKIRATTFTQGPLDLPSRPFAAYHAGFSATLSNFRAIENTLKEISALRISRITLVGYAIYETRAKNGHGRYLTMNQVIQLAKSRALSAEKYLRMVDRRLHLAPPQFIINVKILNGKSHITNFELYRRVSLKV